jgi:hypothetical protein
MLPMSEPRKLRTRKLSLIALDRLTVTTVALLSVLVIALVTTPYFPASLGSAGAVGLVTALVRVHGNYCRALQMIASRSKEGTTSTKP